MTTERTLRDIAREAAYNSQLDFWKDETGRSPEDHMADAVSVAVLQAVRDRIGNQADNCENEAFDALWRVLSGLDEDLALLTASAVEQELTEILSKAPRWFDACRGSGHSTSLDDLSQRGPAYQGVIEYFCNDCSRGESRRVPVAVSNSLTASAGASPSDAECDQCGLKQSEWGLPLAVGAICPKHYLDDDSCDGIIRAGASPSMAERDAQAKHECDGTNIAIAGDGRQYCAHCGWNDPSRDCDALPNQDCVIHLPRPDCRISYAHIIDACGAFQPQPSFTRCLQCGHVEVK